MPTRYPSVLCIGGQGAAQEAQLLRKGGLKAGQALVLTKALGTGTLLAAAMRMRANGRDVQGAPQFTSARGARFID